MQLLLKWSQLTCTSCSLIFKSLSFKFIYLKLCNHIIVTSVFQSHPTPAPFSSRYSNNTRNNPPMGRPPCCDKSNVKRGPWTPEEDAKILAYVASHGIGNWTLVPLKAGLNRCGKSCRLRWTNYLRPDLKHDNFTPEEEECILELHKTIGSRWSLIAKRLPGRTDNDVKNYWNTKLKKKLTKMGIDPITHKPFSQLLSEYGKISGAPSSGSSNHSLHNFAQNIEKPIYDLPSKSHAADSMAQFGVINQEIAQPHFSSEAAASSDLFASSGVMLFGSLPSVSYEPFQVQNVPSSCFACNDRVQMPECDYMGLLSLNNDYAPAQEAGFQPQFAVDGVENFTEVTAKCSPDAATSSEAGLFVDAILAHDSKMQLQFPDILDEIYDY